MLTVRRTVTLVWDLPRAHLPRVALLWSFILQTDSQGYLNLGSRSPSEPVLTALDTGKPEFSDARVVIGAQKPGRHTIQ